jgi:hypothetical protein
MKGKSITEWSKYSRSLTGFLNPKYVYNYKIQFSVLYFANFPYFEKIKVDLRSQCCLYVYESPPHINFWMLEPIFIKLGMYIFLLMFASFCVCITNNSMSFLPYTQHFFNLHYMFRPQRVIFIKCIYILQQFEEGDEKVSDLWCNFNTMCL